MKKLLTLILILCLVLAMSTPVSADYFWEKAVVSADDFANALVDYCNGNEVHNMTKINFRLSGHLFKSYNVTRTANTLDFNFVCTDSFYRSPLIIFPMPDNRKYCFSGAMHDGLSSGLRPARYV